jgi:hypothetical protein
MYGFLRAIKICSTFGGEVKPEAICRKILSLVKEHCEHERDISYKKSTISCAQILLISIL